MDAFRFSPELFEVRSDVLTALERAGFQWFSHFFSVDCLHDLHGIEVCGIREQDDAAAIRQLLMEMFPDWISDGLWYEDNGCEPGWVAEIYRDRPCEDETWETN